MRSIPWKLINVNIVGQLSQQLAVNQVSCEVNVFTRKASTKVLHYSELIRNTSAHTQDCKHICTNDGSAFMLHTEKS